MEDERKWYVITTRPRAEKKVSDGLSKLGVEHYLPLQKQLRQWKDRKKWVELPLFNSYIFVKIEEQYRNEVFEVAGVIKYISIKGKPSTLSAEEVERIRRICNYETEIFVEDQLLNIGDSVEVISGPLKGIQGRLVERANNAYFYIIIEKLNYTASFKIDKNVVQKIEQILKT